MTVGASGAHAALRGPLLSLVIAAALWGAAVSGTKYALHGFDPVTLLSTELLAATLTLWAVLLLSGYRPPASWRVAALLGLLEPALAYLGDTVGLSHTAAVNGSIISGLESGLVVVLAAVLLGETVTRAALVAIVLALGGLVVIAGEGGRGTAFGDICVTAGVLSASLYSIAAKRFDDGSDALSLTTWQFSAATVVSLSVAGLGWIATGHHPRTAAAPRYWLVAVAVGAIGLAFSFLIYNRVLSRVDAGWTAIVLNLIPVFGLLSAISLLGEKLSRGSAIGALLVGASVVYFTICDQRRSRGIVEAPRLTQAGLVALPGPGHSLGCGSALVREE